MRILFVSGGSTGHLAPLVAVERAVKKIDPKTQTHFLCSKKHEDREYLEHEGVAFTQATMPKKNVLFPVTYFQSRRTAKKILKTFRPDVIFSKGGAVSVPLCKAAYKRKIPIVLHESDSVMGKANKMAAPFATAICLGFPPSDEQRKYKAKPIVTGNPVRPGIANGTRSRGLKLTNLTGKRPVLLVIGGSQGASALNDAVRQHINILLSVCDIIHLTGPGKKSAGRRAGYWSKEFAYEELPDLYAVSNLALSRAGAGAISELSANSVPMILVPIRGLANDHQYENAVRAAAAGAAIELPQDCLERDLADAVHHLFGDSEKMKKMKAAAASLQQPEAARHIARILLQCVAKAKKRH